MVTGISSTSVMPNQWPHFASEFRLFRKSLEMRTLVSKIDGDHRALISNNPFEGASSQDVGLTVLPYGAQGVALDWRKRPFRLRRIDSNAVVLPAQAVGLGVGADAMVPRHANGRAGDGHPRKSLELKVGKCRKVGGMPQPADRQAEIDRKYWRSRLGWRHLPAPDYLTEPQSHGDA
jgi:hypothetical protein